MNDAQRRITLLVLGLSLFLGALGRAAAQNPPQRPPEYNELVAASQIKDPALRLKEFERIKAAYPASRFMQGIERAILNAKVEMAPTLEAILAVQRDFLNGKTGAGAVEGPFTAADQILSHPKLKAFDKAAVLAAVLKYRDQTLKAAAEPNAFQGVPAGQQAAYQKMVVTGFGILVAQAYLNSGDATKALAALETFKTQGGALDAAYYYTLGAAYSKLDKPKEAYEAYLAAAADNHQQALAEARALYAKIYGRSEGFEAALEAKLRELPYTPAPFNAPAGWKGKVVLAELFTGSECGPCVAADLGFDGLLETYPAKYLAVLEYHLPIPRPDPMMNAATRVRQTYYGINSTPTVIIDGDKDTTGGGPRGLAASKFTEYKSAIDGRLAAPPDAVLKVKVVRSGDSLQVEFGSDRSVPGAEYSLVLVQGEETYQGSNGLKFHKMVVRDILAVDPSAAKRVTFDLAASELAADQYLTEFENTNKRFQGFKFAERHHKINRGRLRVVFFAQDSATKRVLNAAVADVQ